MKLVPLRELGGGEAVMTTAIQNEARGSVASARLMDEERYDPFQIAMQNAHRDFDPKRVELEQRAATPPLIWYIEDDQDAVILLQNANQSSNKL